MDPVTDSPCDLLATAVLPKFFKRWQDSLSADNFLKSLKVFEILERDEELNCVNQKPLDPETRYGIICGNIRELSGLP